MWDRQYLSHSASKRSKRVERAAKNMRSAILVPAVLPDLGATIPGRNELDSHEGLARDLRTRAMWRLPYSFSNLDGEERASIKWDKSEG